MLIAFIINISLATGYLSVDADVRYVNTDFKYDDFSLKTVGFVVRKVVSDEIADRWILYGQLEVMDDFSTFDIHQMYLMLKGPLGKWNLSAGRIRLPYGLLSVYSTDHVPHKALDPYTIGMENDNGIMASGTAGIIDYSVTATQGSGFFGGFPSRGLYTGRIAINPFVEDIFSAGISAAYGTTKENHTLQSGFRHIKLGALDLTGNVGSFLWRAEISAGTQDTVFQIAGFAGMDLAVLSWLELNNTVSAVRLADTFHHAWLFSGVSVNTRYILLKGGYKYVHYGTIDHQVSLMAYKQFTFNF